MAAAGGDVIGLDWRLPLDAGWARSSATAACRATSTRPSLLGPVGASSRREARRRARARRAAGPGHIFNLGHGVLPETDPDVLDASRRARPRAHARRRSRHDRRRRHPDGVRLARPARRTSPPTTPTSAAAGRSAGARSTISSQRYRAARDRGRAIAAERDHRGRRARRSRPRSGSRCFTGMRHWTPRIADAVDAGARGGRDTLVGLVLAPHYSSLSIARLPARCFEDGARRPRRAALRRELARRAGLRRAARRRASRGTTTRTSSSPRTRCPRGSSTRAIRTATRCSRRAASSPTRAGVGDW